MSIGIAILSGYICLSTHATAVPLGAGAPPALSVIFHPSTKSLTLSAALTKSSLGMNSYSNFMPSFLLNVLAAGVAPLHASHRDLKFRPSSPPSPDILPHLSAVAPSLRPKGPLPWSHQPVLMVS